MSLRILFADDSVTAQNMGKKILTEAGYEVVAVSNGAAAVKKIAEQKPDIIILDVYMPGYSGLEVCEKVRASIATLKTPVLLTVGKMEPYKPEDANRVRADGVIIKPFEASDLLAIIKKFEERIGEVPAPPLVQQTATAVVEEVPQLAQEPRIEAPEPASRTAAQPMVEVPDHMATSSAFSDLLGSESAHGIENFNVAVPQRVPEVKPAAGPTMAAAAVQDYDLPVSWRQESEPVPTQISAPPVSDIPVEEKITAVPTPAKELTTRPLQIPVYQEPESSSYEMLPTAVAPTGDIEIAREPELQENAEEVTRNTVADLREPGLMDGPHMQPEPPSRPAVGVVPVSATDLEIVPELQVSLASPDAEVETMATPATRASEVASEAATDRPSLATVSDSDFEARVAAAMAAYSHPVESREIPATGSALPERVHSAAEHDGASENPETAVDESRSIEAASDTVSLNEETIVPEPLDAPSAVVGETAIPASSLTRQMADTVAVNHDSVAAAVEHEIPEVAAAAAAGTGAEHETIASAVHRVMERIKGDLVEEIVRELNSRK